MRKAIFLLGSCLIVCSCTTSKFDFDTAYKFSLQSHKQAPLQEQSQTQIQEQSQTQFQEQSQVQHQSQQQRPPELLASIKPVQTIVETLPSDKTLLSTASTEEASAAFMEHYKNASKTEKKVIRKQVKEDYKTLRQEVKKAKKEAATKDIVFNKKMYIGVIILGAGILVAILASGPVGAVGIIVGIGLIAWGFIEQA